MCLSIPALIISINGQQAEVEVNNERRQVFLAVDNLKVGDWVLLYAGVALAGIDAETAGQTIGLITKMKLK